MMRNEEIISKGIYGFSQIGGFISVKNYIFMHYGEKICLALRFSNDTDHTFDSMHFCVIQLDALGEVIGRTRVRYENMGFKPGTTYVAENAIEVDSKCVDFKVQIYEAHSGFYRYVPRNRRAVIYYDRKAAQKMLERGKASKSQYTSVKRKEYGRAGVTAAIAIIALLTMLTVNIYYLFSLYLATFPEGQPLPFMVSEAIVEEDIYCGVEYAEI